MGMAARGMAALHGQYGKLRWEQVVSTAEAYARLGHPISRAWAADLLAARPILQADPELRRIFLHDDGARLRASLSVLVLGQQPNAVD